MKNTIPRSAAVLGVAGAVLAATAALGAAPASAVAAPSAVSTHFVHPNTIVFGNCGEEFMFTQPTHIRSGAGLNHSIVGVGEAGQFFPAIYGTSYMYNGYFWVYGTDDSTGVSGWVARSLLLDTGPVGCTWLN
jgi:hypothetical protein